MDNAVCAAWMHYSCIMHMLVMYNGEWGLSYLGQHEGNKLLLYVGSVLQEYTPHVIHFVCKCTRSSQERKLLDSNLCTSMQMWACAYMCGCVYLCAFCVYVCECSRGA